MYSWGVKTRVGKKLWNLFHANDKITFQNKQRKKTAVDGVEKSVLYFLTREIIPNDSRYEIFSLIYSWYGNSIVSFQIVVKYVHTCIDSDMSTRSSAKNLNGIHSFIQFQSNVLIHLNERYSTLCAAPFGCHLLSNFDSLNSFQWSLFTKRKRKNIVKIFARQIFRRA